jgi:hypothetical protein
LLPKVVKKICASLLSYYFLDWLEFQWRMLYQMNQDVLPNESTTQKKNLIFYLSDQALFVTRVLVGKSLFGSGVFVWVSGDNFLGD